MNRLGTAITVAMVVTFCASGCGVPKALGGSGCHKPDPEVVDAIMATAQENFDDGPETTTIARLEPRHAAAIDLPKNERFGDFTMLVALRSLYVEADGDAIGMGAGMLVTDVFASDPTGSKLAELEAKPVSPAAFDIPYPDEPGWAEWSKRAMDENGAGLDVYFCAEK